MEPPRQTLSNGRRDDDLAGTGRIDHPAPRATPGSSENLVFPSYPPRRQLRQWARHMLRSLW
jgi:hypothetical protein